MKQTAMEHHIKDLQDVMQIIIGINSDNNKEIIATFEGAIENAKHYLPKEKDQIIDAHLDAQFKVIGVKKELAEKYYNQTFKPK